jgi:hypothetical protein
MRKALTSIAAAGALAAATVAIPTQANAFAQWVIPAIVIAGVGGVVAGAAVAHADSYPDTTGYAPAGAIYVQPRAGVAAANCHIVRERTPSGWRRVQVCE